VIYRTVISRQSRVNGSGALLIAVKVSHLSRCWLQATVDSLRLGMCADGSSSSFVALAPIGIAAYLPSPPKKRSLEWHKQQYTEAVFNRNKGLFGKLRRPFARAAARAGHPNMVGERQRQRIHACEKALVELGYLEQRTFVLSNQPAAYVMAQPVRTRAFKDATSPGCISVSPTMSMIFDWEGHEVMLGITFRPEDTTRLVLVAPPRDFALWEELLRTVDAPKTPH
jgi:hypothetical protein